VISKLAHPGRVRSIGVALIAFSIVGTALVTQFVVRGEHRHRVQDIVNKGHYLTSLIALFPIQDLEDNRYFFLRVFKEYLSSENLVYCLIHDRSGRSLLSLAPPGLPAAIPGDVQTKSLQSLKLTTQSYQPDGTEYPIYEFSKPIFQNGEKSGTVRLGLMPPETSLFTSEHVSLLAMIVFFIAAAGIFVYYGLTSMLKPLNDLYRNVGQTYVNADAGNTDTEKASGFLHVLDGLERSFAQVTDALRKIESKNEEIAGELGVVNYKKNQILKIIDSINFGIVITDIQNRITFVNAHTVNLLKTEKEQIVDRPLSDAFDNKEILAYITHQESLKSTTPVSHIETEFPNIAPGETFRESLSYMKGAENTATGKMIIIKNITNEKSTEKTRHEFIANVAHEFLTPLTTIQSYTEMLMDDEVGDREMQKEFYNTISDETSRLSEFIRSLLSMSKIEMGGLILEKNIVKTDSLAADSVSAVETNAQKKNIAVALHLPDKFPTLLGDKKLLKTAFINILGNAVKYTPENGKIAFSLNNDDEMIYVTVTDSGYGISEEELPRIFEKFYRSEDPKVREQTGTGLGLAMTSEIIHLHGGDISVESVVGSGTRMTISLPKEEYNLGEP